MKRVLLIVCIGSVMLACNKESDLLSLQSEADFYPLVIGQYRTYQVEEIEFSLLAPDTSRYFLKEVLEDSIVNTDGSVKYLIYRYLSSDNASFELDSVWSVHKFGRSVIVTENNTPYVKLIQPVNLNDAWNGNAYNTQSEVTYYYQASEGTSDIVAVDLAEAELVEVIIEDIPANLVNQDERSETYASGIGLVEKDYVTLGFCTLDCNGVGEIQGGRILRQYLIEYGNL